MHSSPSLISAQATARPTARSCRSGGYQYVLKTGANWAGPIRSFKLTLDPGGSDRLVSFCQGRLKASPGGSTPEYTASDFKPDADLKILVIGKF